MYLSFGRWGSADAIRISHESHHRTDSGGNAQLSSLVMEAAVLHIGPVQRRGLPSAPQGNS